MSIDSEKVESVLSLLRDSDSTRWVADQVLSSFSQGLSMNVKDAESDDRFNALEPANLTTRERRKREKYETTRAYTEQEKLKLLRDALETLYVELPAIQVASLNALAEFGVTTVEFVPPDEPEQAESSYTVNLATANSEQQSLARNFAAFAEEMG
jgi:hypothetical protein